MRASRGYKSYQKKLKEKLGRETGARFLRKAMVDSSWGSRFCIAHQRRVGKGLRVQKKRGVGIAHVPVPLVLGGVVAGHVVKARAPTLNVLFQGYFFF